VSQMRQSARRQPSASKSSRSTAAHVNNMMMTGSIGVSITRDGLDGISEFNNGVAVPLSQARRFRNMNVNLGNEHGSWPRQCEAGIRADSGQVRT
jgi:hypothetical protein